MAATVAADEKPANTASFLERETWIFADRLDVVVPV